MAMGLLVIDDNTPTGYYGELTEAAVRRFQEQQGLPVTGTACAETLKKLLDLRTKHFTDKQNWISILLFLCAKSGTIPTDSEVYQTLIRSSGARYMPSLPSM